MRSRQRRKAVVSPSIASSIAFLVKRSASPSKSISYEVFWITAVSHEGRSGGWGGIRTHETLSRLPVFKTGAFNRSATHPKAYRNIGYFGSNGRSMTKLLKTKINF